MIEAYPRSIARNMPYLFGREHGGEIVEVFGAFTFTGPRRGSTASFSPDVNVPRFAGDYHSHGADSHGIYVDEAFSGDDILGIGANPGLQPEYLVTPSGRMLKYDPHPTRNPSGAIVPMGTVPP